MSNKRILLIHEDRIVTNLYREKLEGSGFSVDSCRSIDQALKSINQRKPDVVILDLVMQAGSPTGLIEALRFDQNTAKLPILVFPNSLPRLSSAAMAAGATRVVLRGRKALGSTIDAAKVAMGMSGLGEAVDADLFSPDDDWLSVIANSGAESVNQMRHCIPALVSASPDLAMLQNLWALVHGTAERLAFLGNRALTQFATAFDLLLADLNSMPEQLNQSTLRTVGQSIDFLGDLISGGAIKLRGDPGIAKILIVDDEASAQQFITAAMQMAGLKNDVAASPSAALDYLKNRHCDLIFLDVGLPEMSGFDLCQKIRTIVTHQKTPVVFLTGMATFQNKAQASLAGGNDFVGKPFNLPELGVKALMWLYRGQLSLL